MNPGDLIAIARQLATGRVGSRRGRPRQAELCRAVSATYYALFHALANSCADTLVGSNRANRRDPAWRHTYRALEHGMARNQCNNQSSMSRFPLEIQEFGKMFVDVQQMRHFADYDPLATFSRLQVIRQIDLAEAAIDRFLSIDRSQRRSFASFVLLRHRP